MNIKRCCFAGHSIIYDDTLVEKIIKKAEYLITEYNVKEFWVGYYGNFDSYSANAVRELKKKYKDIKLICVVAYLSTLEGERGQLMITKFDNIIVSNIPEKTPMPYRILKTNEFMVNNSNFLICYIKNEWGGAYKTYEYAKRKNIEIFNLYKK